MKNIKTKIFLMLIAVSAIGNLALMPAPAKADFDSCAALGSVIGAFAGGGSGDAAGVVADAAKNAAVDKAIEIGKDLAGRAAKAGLDLLTGGLGSTIGGALGGLFGGSKPPEVQKVVDVRENDRKCEFSVKTAALNSFSTSKAKSFINGTINKFLIKNYQTYAANLAQKIYVLPLIKGLPDSRKVVIQTNIQKLIDKNSPVPSLEALYQKQVVDAYARANAAVNPKSSSAADLIPYLDPYTTTYYGQKYALENESASAYSQAKAAADQSIAIGNGFKDQYACDTSSGCALTYSGGYVSGLVNGQTSAAAAQQTNPATQDPNSIGTTIVSSLIGSLYGAISGAVGGSLLGDALGK